ncbi:sensor histidine kinase [Granulicella cerasi]|uniref:histidine kinase n=1 Tax=Granulicella cerasi TaxID=741063 RepID=A0ABW1Z982_9BACT|nr:ATP-binding protein [Granulicella cerasi]
MRISWAVRIFLLAAAASIAGAGLADQLPHSPAWGPGVFFAVWVFFMFGVATALVKQRKHELDLVAHALRTFPAEGSVEHRELAAQLPDIAHSMESVRLKQERAVNLLDEERTKLATMLDSMRDWVVAVDIGGYILWANQPIRQALNGAVGSGKPLVNAVRDPEVLLCMRVALDDAVLAERRTSGLLPGHIHDVTAAPISGGGAVIVMRDATPIERAERTQREFIANVSHELRTPLTSISGYVETLIDHEESLSPMARSFLDIILKNASRMTRLTEDLLALARVENREDAANPVPLAADRIVQDAIASVRGLVVDSGAKLSTGELSKQMVMASSDQIVQVLSNLIENATRYGRTRNGDPAAVEVSATQDGDMVRFAVRDHGIGIGSEHLQRIFERFYRVDKARSRETGGTGLGLAIAKHIIEEHNGKIWVESDLGAGSTFIFTLPLAASFSAP